MGKKSRLAATKSDGKEPNNLDAENQIHIGLPEITRTLSQIRKQQIQYAQQKIQFPEDLGYECYLCHWSQDQSRLIIGFKDDLYLFTSDFTLTSSFHYVEYDQEDFWWSHDDQQLFLINHHSELIAFSLTGQLLSVNTLPKYAQIRCITPEDHFRGEIGVDEDSDRIIIEIDETRTIKTLWEYHNTKIIILGVYPHPAINLTAIVLIDGSIELYDLAGEFIATAITPFSDTETNYIQEFQWHPTRPLFLIESEEQVELWKIDQNKITKIFHWQPTREDEFIDVCYLSPLLNFIAVRTCTSKIILLNIETQKKVASLLDLGFSDYVPLSWHPNGQILAVGYESTIFIFDFSDSNQWLHQTELKLDVAVSDQNSFQYSNIELNTIIEDATVDAHDEEEQLSGWESILEDSLRFPFPIQFAGKKCQAIQIEFKHDRLGLEIISRGKKTWADLSEIAPQKNTEQSDKNWLFLIAYQKWAALSLDDIDSEDIEDEEEQI